MTEGESKRAERSNSGRETSERKSWWTPIPIKQTKRPWLRAGLSDDLTSDQLGLPYDYLLLSLHDRFGRTHNNTIIDLFYSYVG